VKRISQSLNHQSAASLPFIGVLDIFGFEDFTTNGLEQLLINYANEALQSIYAKEVLISEHELFVEEGLQDIHVGTSFKYNDGCLDLIGSGSKSVISYLDSVCVRPGIDEEVFTSLLHTNLNENPYFPAPKTIEKREKFKIKHYARVVTYTVGTFISRNMDVRLPELEELLLSSTHNAKCGLFLTTVNQYDQELLSRTISSGVPPPSSPIVTRDARVSSLGTPIPSENNLETTVGRESRVQSLSKIDAMKLKLDVTSSASSSSSSSSPTPTSSTGKDRQRGNNKKYTVGGLFIKQMTELTKTLLLTKCSFVRCIKPNPTMTPGKFDRSCVIDQLRCLGVIQTCEVLKAGMPTRIRMSELETMYRPLLPEKLQHILQHISDDAFIRALMWAFQIPTDSYKIGKTRIFFRIGKISVLSELTDVNINSERGQLIALRLKRYVARIWWRKALIKMYCDYSFLQLFEKCRLRINSIVLIQRNWKKFIHSEKKIRQKYLRRRWRMAFLFVRCQNILLREYHLIREATNMRLEAEAYAEETIRKMKEAEDQETRLHDEQHHYHHQQEGGGNVEENEQRYSTSSNDEMHGNSTPRGEMTERGRAQSNAVVMNQAKMKSEMQALVAASSLATVSVCLFRWTKIKLFAAFETWLAILPPEVLEQQQRLKPLASRMSLDESEPSPFDRQDSGEWSPPPSPILQLKSDLLPSSDQDANISPNTRNIVQPTAKVDMTLPTRPPLDKTAHKRDLSNLLQPKDSTSSLLSLQTKPRGGVIHMQLQEIPVTDGKCYECEQRDGVLWCPDCGQDYCKVCSQFVHECCKAMKTHLPVSIDQKKFTPIRKLIPMEGGGGLAVNSVPFENPPGNTTSYGRRRTHSDSVLREDSMISSFHEDDSFLEAVREEPTSHEKYRPPETPTHLSARRRRLSFQTRQVPSNAESMPFSMSMARGGDDHSHKDPCAIKTCTREACKGISIRFCEEHYEEFRSSMKGGQSETGGNGGQDNDTKTLQQQVALLKRQLQESGQQPVEFVELSVARDRMQQAVQRLMGGEEAAEKDIERWDKAIRMNPEYQKEMEEKAKQWEIDQQPINHQCLMKMRSLIPPNVSSTTLAQMLADGLPKTIANRIWTKKSLWIINTHPDDTKKVHIADLNTKYGNQGLDIVEMRAIWANLPLEFDNDGDGKKAQWRGLFRQKLEELTVKEASNRLSAMEKRNPAYKTHDTLSVYDPNVEITRTEIQKSTAFDVTEKPEIKSTLGEGIKELKKQMAAAEKPFLDGTVTHLPQGSGDADGGKRVWVSLLLQKKSILIYSSQKAAEATDQTPEQEFLLLPGHTIKSGPGKATFCVMSGETELLVFQTEKNKRDKWVEGLNEIIKVVNTAPKIVKKVAAVAAPTPAEDQPPERPKPSFLSGIANKRKETNTGESDSPAPEKPSFLSAIAAGKKKSGGGAGGGGGAAAESGAEKPSFLSAISARKKGGGENQDNKPSGEGGGGNPLLAGIAARRKDLDDTPPEAGSPSPTTMKKKKETRTEDI
jgi:hypothetical protein